MDLSISDECAEVIDELVLFAGGGASGEAVGGEMQFLAMAADPADAAGRIADHQSESRDVLGDYRARTNQTILTQRVATDNRSIGTHRSTTANERLAVLVLARDRRTRVDDVGEDHARAQEDIVRAADTGVDGDVVLHLAVAA